MFYQFPPSYIQNIQESGLEVGSNNTQLERKSNSNAYKMMMELIKCVWTKSRMINCPLIEKFDFPPSLLRPQCCKPMGFKREEFFFCSILDRSNIIYGEAGLYEPLFMKWFVSLFSCGNLSFDWWCISLLKSHRSYWSENSLIQAWSCLVPFWLGLFSKSFYVCRLQVVKS